MQADTIIDGPNRYMYVRGNPLKYTDPTGHCSEFEGTRDSYTCSFGSGGSNWKATFDGGERSSSADGFTCNVSRSTTCGPNRTSATSDMSTRTGIRTTLNILSFIPGIDVAADGALCGDSAANGTRGEAVGDCAAAALPGVGVGWLKLGEKIKAHTTHGAGPQHQHLAI